MKDEINELLKRVSQAHRCLLSAQADYDAAERDWADKGYRALSAAFDDLDKAETELYQAKSALCEAAIRNF